MPHHNASLKLLTLIMAQMKNDRNMERLTHENNKVPSLCTIVQSCFAVAGNYRCESVDCCACIDDDDDYAERHRVKTAVDWSPNDSNSSSQTRSSNHPLPAIASDCDDT